MTCPRCGGEDGRKGNLFLSNVCLDCGLTWEHREDSGVRSYWRDQKREGPDGWVVPVPEGTVPVLREEEG